MWIVPKKIINKWNDIIINIPDEITVDEWIHMLQTRHNNNEFKKVRKGGE